MDTSQWVSVQREDGETVGYLEPATADYAQVIPRNTLGHPVNGQIDYATAESQLVERGIGELMGPWVLDFPAAPDAQELTILELSQQGIVLANALQTKALQRTERIHVRWPDVDQRLSLSDSHNSPSSVENWSTGQ